MMTRTLALVVLLGISLQAAEEAAKAPAKTEPLPPGMAKFNGMLIGKLVASDIEKGTFTVTVDRVSRVWRNSKAEDPKSCVGRTLTVDGVFGKWLDSLLLVKPGETLQFEARHDGGDTLTFPGEMLRKVAPVKPGEYPELPEQFRGFQGVVVGRVADKDVEMGEVRLIVKAVPKVSEKSTAKKPEAILGKPIIVAGFWGKRRGMLLDLEKDDTLEVELQHISLRSDHLSIAELVRKVETQKSEQ